MDKITLAIASDLSGFPLREAIVNHLRENYADSIKLIDFGIESEKHPKPYFEQAPKVARAIQNGDADKGIIICGTGQGMAIVANKFKGIYAAVVDSVFAAERSKIINNANVITM
jgi:ribose 5-phosphate isomerase B